MWRGGVSSGFRRLRGATFRGGLPCVASDGRWLAHVDRRRGDVVTRRISQGRDRIGSGRVIGRIPTRRNRGFGDCAWSPDGGSIAVTVQDGIRGKNTIRVFRRDGSGFSQPPYASDHFLFAPAWSSTGRHRARAGRHNDRVHLVLMGPEGEHVQEVRRGGRAPAWSPDGQRLAFIDSSGSKYVVIDSAPLLVADANGANAARLVRGYIAAAAFSPDGRRLAFARSAGARCDYCDEIVVTRPDGTKPRAVRMPESQAMWITLAMTWSQAPYNDPVDPRTQPDAPTAAC